MRTEIRRQGILQLPKMNGLQIREGVVLIGEPTPITGSDKLRCLANVLGALCVVELSITFLENAELERAAEQRRDGVGR